MSLGALLKTFIYIISASLLYPVLFLLVILTIWTLVYAGAFFAEWMERIKIKKALQNKSLTISEGYEKIYFPIRVRQYINVLEQVLINFSSNIELEAENLLQERIIALWASLDKVKLLIRIGPGLGLIGTLIPMGTGLAALGQGDMTSLSADLVIAFTTTVVGLAIGMTCYFFYTIKQRWVEKDIKDMAVITELFVNNYKRDTKNEILKEKVCRKPNTTRK